MRLGFFVKGVGFFKEQLKREIDKEIIYVAKNRHVGQTGSIIVYNSEKFIVSDSKGNIGKSLAEVINVTSENPQPDLCFNAEIYGKSSLCMYTEFEGYYILALLSESEAFLMNNASVYMHFFMNVLIFAILFATIYFLVQILVVNNIHKINESLFKITEGNLDTIVDVHSSKEFASLSEDINSTVAKLKQYIDEVAARYEKDLEIGKQIQQSALPSVFPTYPQCTEFDIFASMDAAREVGGDFYDFYYIDKEHFAFIVADVSGKGIPGAMFMMTSKTLIKSYAETNIPVNEVFKCVNTGLCENNEAGMFVTAWMGILDLKTGLLKYANAGHNPPLIKHKDRSFEYLKTKSNFVLAGMENVHYREQEVQLEAGDIIFLYTDGVTEAHNPDNALYGEERLLRRINSIGSDSVSTICKKIKEDVNLYVDTAEQFDDITMLCIHFKEETMDNELKIHPSMENFAQVTDFVETRLEKFEVDLKFAMKFMVALDEVYSNIIRYSQATDLSIKIKKIDGGISFIFTDNGIPYNPMEVKSPDTTVSSEERELGGLGIYMVRKLMNSVEYEYDGKNNLLKLTKFFLRGKYLLPNKFSYCSFF